MPSSSTPGSPIRDPLTTIFFLFIYPIFFILLSILHLTYYCCLKVTANIRWQRYIFTQVRQRPDLFISKWRSGFGLQSAGARTAEQASEERLLKRGNVVRTMGRLINVEGDIVPSLKSSKKQQALAPRHLAVVLANKPVHTRILIYRALIGLISTKRANSQLQRENKEREQISFALQSAQKILHCSALLGIEEVTIFDEAGRLKKNLSGKQEWILEWSLEQEWQETRSFSDQFLSHQQFSTPRSDSFASSTMESFSSACEVTPSLQNESPSKDLHGNDSTNQATKDITPRLRVVASLQSSSSCKNCFLRVEQSSSNESYFLENIFDAKIKLNLLDAEDGKKSVAKTASAIASRQEMTKVVEVKMIDCVLQGECLKNMYWEGRRCILLIFD